MAVSQDELERDIQSAEREFLAEAMTDDEVDDVGAIDEDDVEFDEQLELAGEITLRTGSASSDEEVVDFLANGCGCTKLANGPCYQELSAEDVSNYRLAISELENSEVDLTILAQLHAGMNAGELLTNTRGSARPGIRQRVTFQYAFKGQPICREMFLFLHRISRTRLYNLVKHLCANGIVPRTHGNKGKMPKHAMKFDEITRVVDFIKCYADIHAVPLPGRLPKHHDYRVMKLPSDVSKATVYRDYAIASEALRNKGEEVRIISYRQFRRLWQELVPFVTTMKPSSDLCFVCQENVAAIMRSTNLPEDEKSENLKSAEEHLTTAKEERKAYNDKKEISKANWEDLPREHHHGQGSSHGNLPISMLYSFDHAQLVHIPSNPLQPGPAYFKTARKCEIFGICCEGSRIQVNYLIDEGESIGKGANSIISYLHHYLDVYGVGEQHLELQADNCVGQNKNNPMIQYLAWRCFTKKSSSCSIHFMLVGHTRFSPDQYFGMIKRKYRKTRVSSISQLSKVVSESTDTGMNKVQLAFDKESGCRVPCYDWKSFLSSRFKVIPSITKYHHFKVSHDNLGVVELHEFAHSSMEKVDIQKLGISIGSQEMPEVIPPPGIPIERQKYLYEQIRMFCEPEYADITCPQPESDDLHQPSPEVEQSSPPPAKRARLCSHCRLPGHTKTVCGKVTCPQLLKE